MIGILVVCSRYNIALGILDYSLALLDLTLSARLQDTIVFLTGKRTILFPLQSIHAAHCDTAVQVTQGIGYYNKKAVLS